MKNKKYIEPQFLYDKNGDKPSRVYLSIEDYQALIQKFEVLKEKLEQSKKVELVLAKHKKADNKK